MAGYGYRGNFSNEMRVGKDKKGYMIDATCYDDKTEVLTVDGWKLFRDCLKTDSLATLNVDTNEIEYQTPTHYITKNYDGEMVRISNRKQSIDCLVTPDHDILRTDRFKKRMFKEKASDLTDKGFIPRTGTWKSTDEEDFVLPEYHHEWNWVGMYGQTMCRKVYHAPAISIKLGDWAEFMAWYLSEGSNNHRSSVSISQTKHPDKIKLVLNKLPFHYTYDGKMFTITSTQLTRYLEQFGTSHHKRVPGYIKNASKRIIGLFLDAYCWGDGSRRPSGDRIYITSSEMMANDLQELIFKFCSVANICMRKTKGTPVEGLKGKKKYYRKCNLYIIREHTSFFDFWFETKCRKEQYITHVPYIGKVYCATVPNGTLYVRRNGKPFWCGNCRQPCPPGEIMLEMYTNISEIIWAGSNGIMVDPEPRAKYAAEIMMGAKEYPKSPHCIEFPEEHRQNIKLSNAVKIDGSYYTIPGEIGLSSLGAVVGFGDTLQEANDEAKEIAETIEGDDVHVCSEGLDEAQAEIAKSEKFGVSLFEKGDAGPNDTH
jgi:hypothetical protein